MPDHLHWLIQLTGSRSLGEFMQSLKRHTSRGINRHLGRAGGPVWQEGYFDRALRAEDDIRAVARSRLGTRRGGALRRATPQRWRSSIQRGYARSREI